jgi:hypothetical protein
VINGRRYLKQSVVDRYDAELIAGALGAQPVFRPPCDPDPLIPMKRIADRYGVGLRTIGRRIKAARDAEAEQVATADSV